MCLIVRKLRKHFLIYFLNFLKLVFRRFPGNSGPLVTLARIYSRKLKGEYNAVQMLRFWDFRMRSLCKTGEQKRKHMQLNTRSCEGLMLEGLRVRADYSA